MNSFQLNSQKILETELPKQYSYNSTDSNSIIFLQATTDFLNEMHNYSINEKLYEFLEYRPFKLLSQTESYLKKILKAQRSEDGTILGVVWFVRRVSDNRLIGSARLTNIDYDRRSVEWGYGIDPDLWGLGYVLHIQNSIKKYVFKKLKFNRLYGGTRFDNERTKSSLIATGVRHEGISYQVLRDYKGKYHDVWNYSILAKDYFDAQDINSNYSKKSIRIDEIIDIISKSLNDDNINKYSDMNSVTKWDSLSHIQIILDIEKFLDFKFTSEQIAASTSVDKIHSIISK